MDLLPPKIELIRTLGEDETRFARQVIEIFLNPTLPQEFERVHHQRDRFPLELRAHSVPWIIHFWPRMVFVLNHKHLPKYEKIV